MILQKIIVVRLIDLNIIIQMGGEATKEAQQQQLAEDIQFMLSSIRARENNLILYLEHFSKPNKGEIDTEEYKVYKRQFLQKQKIYSNQVRQVVQKYSMITSSQTLTIFKTFWIKLKSIFRVSLERVRAMKNLLDDTLSVRYQQILKAIDQNFNDCKGVKQYVQIEYLVKKRTVQALISGKNLLVSCLADSKIVKNRSESLFKQQRRQNQSLSPINLRGNHIEVHGVSDQASSIYHKLKSLSRPKGKRGLVEKQSKNKISNRDYKKFQTQIQKYEKNIGGVMDGKIEYSLDKKKSIYENVYHLYDSLFERNIANHKIISKYAFNCGRASKIISQQQLKNKKIEKKRMNDLQLPKNSSKIVKKGKIEISQTMQIQRTIQSDKKKLMRPKTSKTIKGRQKHILKQLKIA